MTTGASSWWSDRNAGALVVGAALVAAGAFVMNGWVQDDGPKILFDPRIHEWSGLYRGFVESYWAPPSKSGLFRPLAMAAFTAQWMLGGGEVLLFRIIDLLLYAGSAYAVWCVARRLLPRGPAAAVGILFAVHPVHTEVMAAAVNQGESVVVILAGVSILLWWDLIEGRRRAATVFPLLALAYVAALGFKEHALILPVLCMAAELKDTTTPWRERLRARGPLLAGLLSLGVVWWLWRGQVLGDLAGAAAAEGLRGDSIGQRLVTMLGVVPEWIRLVVWPASLRSDYAPRQIDPDLGWGIAQWIGVFALIGWSAALRWAWSRDRTIAIGLLIVAVGLAPVSNVLVPTGILLAERTLFLPSVGVVLVFGALLMRGVPWWRNAAPGARGVVGMAGAALVMAAVARDIRRAPDWHDFGSFITAQLRDAPLSWRAHTGYGIWAFEQGDRLAGERNLREAIALWPHHARPYHTLADYYRSDGLCEPAAPLYAAGLEREPDRPRQRLSATACLLWLGRYAEAATTARGGAPTDRDAALLVAAADVADSAARVRAPHHTVRLAPLRDHASEIGWRSR